MHLWMLSIAFYCGGRSEERERKRRKYWRQEMWINWPFGELRKSKAQLIPMSAFVTRVISLGALTLAARH